MTTEKRAVEVTAYRDDDGKPTCALNFATGEVCIFYRTQRYGCNETCALAEWSVYSKMANTMRRRKRPDDLDYERNGTLIPLDECPVWKGEER